VKFSGVTVEMLAVNLCRVLARQAQLSKAVSARGLSTTTVAAKGGKFDNVPEYAYLPQYVKDGNWPEAPKGEVHPGYQKIKEKYKLFQAPNDTPVWLKGGIMDLITYRLIILLISFGLVKTFYFYYLLAYALPIPENSWL